MAEVLVINTNTGMEVYYYTDTNYFLVIKKAVSSYLLDHVDSSKLKFKDNDNREEVFQSFSDAFFTFAKYPQLFLAYAKKFKFIRDNKDSPYIMPILNTFFENSIRTLAKTSTIPHYDRVRNYAQTKSKAAMDDVTIKALVDEVLLKIRSN